MYEAKFERKNYRHMREHAVCWCDGQEESVGAMKNGREGQTYGERQVKEMLPI